MKSSTKTRAFVAFLASAAFVWTLALSASPQLHGRVHNDADRPGHSCAVTLIASGSFDHSVPPSLVSEPIPVLPFSQRPILSPQWVESLFLSARVFEHAPPAHS